MHWLGDELLECVSQMASGLGVNQAVKVSCLILDLSRNEQVCIIIVIFNIIWNSIQQNHPYDTLSNFPEQAKKSNACIEM